MVLVIMAILAAVAFPLFSDTIARYRLRAATAALTDTLQHAREVGLQRTQGTVVCPSENGRTCSGRTDWSLGWISRDGQTKDVLAFEEPLDARLDAFSTGIRTEVVFAQAHDEHDARPTNQKLALCLRGKPATAVTVVIARNGHSHVEPASPEIARACGARHSRNR